MNVAANHFSDTFMLLVVVCTIRHPVGLSPNQVQAVLPMVCG